MAYSPSLAARVRSILVRRHGFAEKRMFGGLCFLLHGKICVGVWKDSLLVRVGVDQAPQTLEKPFTQQMTTGGKPMRGWILVEPDGVDSDTQLQGWIDTAIEIVQSLPEK